MFDLILTFFRFLFLAALYLFIFQLVRTMFRDLRAGEDAGGLRVKAAAGRSRERTAGKEVPQCFGAGAGLSVVASGDPGLPPGILLTLKDGEETSLGRSSRNTLTLVDPSASMDHAVIYRSGDQYWLSDRGSKNGTYLGGVRINAPAALADGDRISIGGVTLQFVRWDYEMEPGDGSGACKKTERR